MTDLLSREEIREQLAVEAAATEAPWEIPDDGESVNFSATDNDGAFVVFIPEDHLEPADRRWIEAARANYGKALATALAYRELRERVEKIRSKLSKELDTEMYGRRKMFAEPFLDIIRQLDKALTTPTQGTPCPGIFLGRGHPTLGGFEEQRGHCAGCGAQHGGGNGGE